MVVHHPSILKGRDDVPRRELEKFMANTTEVLVMIEVPPSPYPAGASANFAGSHCTVLTEELTAAVAMLRDLKIGLCLQERASTSTLLVYHTTAFAAKDDADPKQHTHKVCQSPHQSIFTEGAADCRTDWRNHIDDGFE